MLSNFLIKVIVLFLPTQLGFHYWPEFARVAGIKVDYLSPTLYFVDLLLLLLIILNFKKVLNYLIKHYKPLSVFLIFILINILFSVSPLNSLFWWLRVNFYLLVFIVLRLRKLKLEDIKKPLIIGTSFIVLIELLQVIFQSSLGGPLYFLGERMYSQTTPGIGRFNLFGLEVLRPMGTFSHPNSLAGYLLIVFYLFSQKNIKPWYKTIPFLGILLTISKTAIFTLALLIFNFKPETIIIFSLIFTLAQPLIQKFPIYWQSLSDRLFFYSYLDKIFLINPLTGVGLGNFIPALGKFLPGSYITPAKLQPIHNIYFLFISELGILGTILAIASTVKNKVYELINRPQVIGLLAIVLFTGAFDHYIWTLPQNKLILLFALSILF